MAYSNADVAELLTNIATAYEIVGKGNFEIKAYLNAADTTVSYPEDIFELWQKDPKSLDNIPNIGQGIAKKIDYLFTHGQLYPQLKPVFDQIHPAVFTFTKINGIGPLNAQKLTKNLKFSKNPARALNQLIKYCQKGKIKNIPTFGEKSEASILDNTLSFLGRKNRMPLNDAQILATNIIKFLKEKFPQIEFIALGSLRRQSATAGDIDIAAASSNPKPILDYFRTYPESLETINHGTSKCSLRLTHDVRVDLMVKPPESFGALLQHFTGSRQHNILLRRHALKLGLSLSEYGIKNLKTGKINKFPDEISFYDFLGLKFIPPELRSGENELESFKK